MRVARFEDELERAPGTLRRRLGGSGGRAVERVRRSGVQRIMLNHELFDDLEMLDVLAERVFPQVASAS